jgi:ribosomal protein S20
MVSEPDEEQGAFLARLQHLAHEKRDIEVEVLRKKYATKFQTLQDRQRRAEQAVEKSAAQSKQKKMDAAISAGSALLGALFGRKALSATSVSKLGTAVKSTGRAFQSGDAIQQAQENLQVVQQQLLELEEQLQKEVDTLVLQYEGAGRTLEEVEVQATSSNITVHHVGILWLARPL